MCVKYSCLHVRCVQVMLHACSSCVFKLMGTFNPAGWREGWREGGREGRKEVHRFSLGLIDECG